MGLWVLGNLSTWELRHLAFGHTLHLKTILINKISNIDVTMATSLTPSQIFSLKIQLTLSLNSNSQEYPVFEQTILTFPPNSIVIVPVIL